MMRRRSVIIALLANFLLVTRASAQPLADRVPADALVYVGWMGSQNLGPAGYEGSHLQALAASSDAQKLFTETLPKLSKRIGAGNAEAGEVMNAVSAIGGRMWRHPSAFYFSGLDFTANPRKPQPKIAFLCDAGDEAAVMAKDLQAIIDRAGKTPVEMKVVPNGTLVKVTIGPVDADGKAKAAFLPTKASFTDALSQVHNKNAVAAIYVDFEGIFKMLDDAPATSPREQKDKANWVKARDALGLTGVKSAIWTGAFDGKDWSCKAFVAAPGPRTGLVSLIDSKPISDDLLKLVPSTAVMCMAGHFDAAKLMTESRAVAGRIDPNGPKQFDQKLEQFHSMTGVDLEKDVIAPLGDEWAMYTDPNVAGTFSFAATLISRPKDPAKLDQSFVQLGRAVTNLSGIVMAPKGMSIPVREMKDGELTIHYFATPVLRPSWTIDNGVLYVGLFPQVVSAAVANAKAPGRKSILENDSFIAVRKRLGNDIKPTCISYVDLPKTAPGIYPAWLFISGYAGFADLFGAPGPAMLIPPLNDLLAQLAPAGSISWVDDKGWHASGISPFPGAQLLASDPSMNLGSTALVTSIMLPALNKSRETAKRVQCASNMRQIGMACLLYANENKGKYPPDLGTLLKTQDITVDAFVCPSSGNTVPGDLKGANVDVQAAWVNASSSYTYLGAGLINSLPAQTVVLYEKKTDHDEAGMNLLYGDGHVEWKQMPQAEQEIAKSAAAASKKK